ncbi:MAG: hypothetical protein R3F37_23830 [Candidatus Competibacteraceae bacterium]
MQYLSALRALIDALTKYLFLMIALTPDALQRYQETLPALKGRLANVVSFSQSVMNKKLDTFLAVLHLNKAQEKGAVRGGRNRKERVVRKNL